MRKQKGITLISLVISIIVMLILAGVALSAAIGENGIISQTQYATFLNEMAAVEEAVALWKINQKETAIPANGLCQEATLSIASNKNAERLHGEVGYYRLWSTSQTMPTVSVLADSTTFNNACGAEVVYYPAGAQDLYYLDNDALGIDSKKEYIIDAVNSMVYSATGIAVKGVRVYSTAMAKAVMDGTLEAPLFAEAEVSGTGTGESLAGNEEHEHGFQIMADVSNNNIYKLYNNGDLYGKGIKGIALNSSEDEMKEINAGIFQELKFPGELIGTTGEVSYNEIINSGVQVIPGNGTMYVIDANGYLWAWGNNDNNKLGLTQDQQIEYTGTEIVKLNVGNQKVKKVFPTTGATFVVTDEVTPRLFAAGNNTSNRQGCLGLGHSNSVNAFEEVSFEKPENIIKIQESDGDYHNVVILCNDNRMYASGYVKYIFSNFTTVLEFTPIFNGVNGENIVAEIQDFEVIRGLILLKKDGTVWSNATNFWCWGYDVKTNGLQQFPTTFSTDVKKMYRVGPYSVLLEKNNGELWFHRGRYTWLGEEFDSYYSADTTDYYRFKLINDFLPEELKNDGIKQIIGLYNNGIYFLSNSNKLYVSGRESICGINSTSISKYTSKIESAIEYNSNIAEYNINEFVVNGNMQNFLPMVKTEENKILTIENSKIIFRDKILQKTWKKMNPDGVKIENFIAKTYRNAYAFIDSENNLWIAGNDSSYLGVNSKDEVYNNFIMHPDNNIRGKVKDVCVLNQGIYVLTIDNKLYATGIHNGANATLGFPTDTLTFELLMENVQKIEGSNQNLLILSDKLYFLGWNHYYIVQNSNSGYTNTPIEVGLPEGYTVENIVDMKICSANNTALILEKDNERKIFICGSSGTSSSSGINGLGQSVTVYTELKINNLQENEYLYDITLYGSNGGYIVTNLGNMYAWGQRDKLGIGSTSTDKEYTPIDVNQSNVFQVACGNGWVVLTKKDGTVYGTGSNVNGILGRWIGIDRNSPNSRYKTAFDWVECPELEI